MRVYSSGRKGGSDPFLQVAGNEEADIVSDELRMEGGSPPRPISIASKAWKQA